MNVLLMSLMYPDDQLEEVTRNAKDKLQNQINSYQRAFVQGIRQNLQEGERLDIVNSLPVGIWPLQYRQLFLKGAENTLEKLTKWFIRLFHRQKAEILKKLCGLWIRTHL